MLLVTHDMGVVASVADRVAVVYAGSIVEDGPVVNVYHRPLHPYTSGLLGSLPSLTRGRPRPDRRRDTRSLRSSARMPVRRTLPIRDRKVTSREARTPSHWGHAGGVPFGRRAGAGWVRSWESFRSQKSEVRSPTLFLAPNPFLPQSRPRSVLPLLGSMRLAGRTPPR